MVNLMMGSDARTNFVAIVDAATGEELDRAWTVVQARKVCKARGWKVHKLWIPALANIGLALKVAGFAAMYEDTNPMARYDVSYETWRTRVHAYAAGMIAVNYGYEGSK